MVRHYDRILAINRIRGMQGMHNITIKVSVYATKNFAMSWVMNLCSQHDGMVMSSAQGRSGT